jgi:tetratricopeptide (TPR) repeat protein
MMGTNKRYYLFFFSLAFLLSFSNTAAKGKDSLKKDLTECLALLEKHSESKVVDKLLQFLYIQNDYAASEFTAELEQILKKNPNTLFAHYQLGFVYAEDITKYDKAVAEFNKGIDICRQRDEKLLSGYIPFFNYRLASLWLKNGLYQEALEQLEVLKKEVDFPYRAQVYNKTGVACYYQDMLYKAVDNFKTALIIDSKYAEAKFNLKSLNLKLERFNAGRVYLRMRQYGEAEAEFVKAIKQSPNFIMARHYLGLVYTYQNKLDKAIEEYKRVKALAPYYQRIHEVQNLLGSAYISLGFRIDDNRKLKTDYLKKGISELKSALSLKPGFSEVRKNLAHVYQTEDLVSLMGFSHLEAGNEYLITGLFSQALEEFDKVLEADPQNKQANQKRLEAILGWAISNSCKKKNYDQAITVCKKFLPDISGSKTKNALTLLLGYVYMQKGDLWYDKAVEELRKIPDNPQVNYYLGLIYFNQGQFTNALNEFQQAKRADMDNPEYFFMLAKLHFYLKNDKLAKRLYQKALEKMGLQMDRVGKDSFEMGSLCERRSIYEQDFAYVQSGRDRTGILPSDRESIGLLINSDNLDAKKQKSVYKFIKRYLEKETGLTAIDYKKYSSLLPLIPEDCTVESCLAEYSWLTDTDKLLMVDLDQWGDRLLVSFSVYHSETKYKESIHEQESQGVEFYDFIKQSLEGVVKFFKAKRTRAYCELCPQI